jgi:hypothetical protein
LAVAVVGCGSGHARRAQSPAERPVSGDGLAYLAIARASAALRMSAAPAAVGKALRIANRPSLTTAARSLVAVHTRDARLLRALADARAALASVTSVRSDRRSQHAAALRAIAATDRINRYLRLYAARHPELQSLVPD